MQPPIQYDFEFIEPLGEFVYKARDVHVDRLVAIKYLPPDLGQHPLAYRRFIRTTRIMAGLEHPNIVAPFCVGQVQHWLYLGMEFAPGITLLELCKRGLPSERAAKIDLQLRDVKDYAAGMGIILNEIRPEHVVVNDNDNVKVSSGAWKECTLRR